MTELGTTTRQPAAGRPRRPGVVPLRPLLVGEILDGAVSAMRTHPGIMLGLSAVVVATGQVLAIPLDYLYLRFLSGLVDSSTSNGGGSGINLLAALSPGTLIDFVTETLLTGLLTVAVSRAVLGRPIALEEVWRTARPRLPRLIGLTLLVIALSLGPGVLCIVLGALVAQSSALGGGLLILVGVLGGGVWALNRWVAWMLSGAALMLEDQKVFAALKRSAVLVKSGWWRVLGIALLAVLVAFLASGILSLVEQVSGFRVNPATDNPDGTVSAHQVTWLGVVASAAIHAAIQSVTAPFIAAVAALQYIDRRMRREGLDIQLARSGGGDGGPSGTPGTSAAYDATGSAGQRRPAP